MRKRMQVMTLLGMAGALWLLISPAAEAQDTPRVEVGLDYNYVHSNAPPGGCGCISMNGGDGWVAFNFTHSFAGVAQISGQRASDIDGVSGSDLTFVSYLFGPRFSLRRSDRFMPFGQALFGMTHATTDSALLGSNSNNSFALTAGGGLDIGISRHFAIRPAQLDYFLTRFSNGSNDHQNNFRFSAGIYFRF